MTKKDIMELFTDEVCNKPPKKNLPTNKIIYIDIDELKGIDLAHIIDYKFSNNKE